MSRLPQSSWIAGLLRGQFWKAAVFLLAVPAFLYLGGCAWFAPARSSRCGAVEICAGEPSYPGHPGVRTARLPSPDAGHETRICDALGSLACETSSDIRIDVERTKSDRMEFLVSVFATGRPCKPFGELRFELVEPPPSAAQDSAAEVGSGSAFAGPEEEDEQFCGLLTLVYPDADPAGPAVLDVTDTGPEAERRPWRRLRFVWE